MTEPRYGECRPPLNQPACWARWGALRIIQVVFWFPANQLTCAYPVIYRKHPSLSDFCEYVLALLSERQRLLLDNPHDDDGAINHAGNRVCVCVCLSVFLFVL